MIWDDEGCCKVDTAVRSHHPNATDDAIKMG